jgi:ABC-type cobalamin/Fe3+-siderophores transport system ATPase subunit
MLIHQEELAALDEGVLVFDLTHVLEVVAVLRHAHTEEAATLR